ncbi:uncharacterized protein LOC125946954 [Dermacentor silvarum]|uniref:uncharacterized protein LOC125946954 n=1 Tax=Dermacentor silvarum TaxID=543639 RepID=UPI00210137F4|nr:uncharacterized protein LOC125946954 [Dermacentor silvarum]
MELLAGFLFSVCLVLSECKFGPYPMKAYSIRKFLDTTEPIWTVYTTGPTTRRCEVDEVLDVTKASVYIKRHFFLRGKQMSTRITGTFSPYRTKHMEIHISGSPYIVSEDILYLSAKLDCAVIMTTTNIERKKKHTYDVRVRNSAISLSPGADCLARFRDLVNWEQVIYTRDCQHVLNKKPTSLLTNKIS